MLVAAFLVGCGEQPIPTGSSDAGPAPTFSKARAPGQAGVGDPEILAMMHEMNAALAEQGLNIAVEAIDLFTIGAGRPSNRILQQPFRWVPNDARRVASGIDITYLVDQSNSATASGLSAAATEAAVDAALATWNAEQSLQKVSVVKVADPGTDPTIFDEFFPPSGDDDADAGFPFFADIVNAGFYSRTFFGNVTGAPDNVLAFSVTFIFLDAASGNDINGDGYIDTALNEVYYNDTFGAPGEPRVGNPWGINVPLPGIDVQTVALHENGHSLELGHFGPAPDAVMNPVFAGIRILPFPTDKAGMNAVWSSWPNP